MTLTMLRRIQFNKDDIKSGITNVKLDENWSLASLKTFPHRNDCYRAKLKHNITKKVTPSLEITHYKELYIIKRVNGTMFDFETFTSEKTNIFNAIKEATYDCKFIACIFDIKATKARTQLERCKNTFGNIFLQ